MSDKIYTTWGSVRGCCGHRHKTLEAAEKCLKEDQRGCAKQGHGCYSDRAIYLADKYDRDIDRYSNMSHPGELYGYSYDD